MQIFILVDKKDVCSKHTWCNLVEENLKEGYAKCQYFSGDPIFKLNWNEYLTYDEYIDAIHNYKIITEAELKCLLGVWRDEFNLIK